MKVIYSEAHRAHDAPFEIFEGGNLVPAFERPARMDSILAALRVGGQFQIVPPQSFDLSAIRAIHDADYIKYLQTAFEDWQREGGELRLPGPKPGSVLYPSTFMPRRAHHCPKSLAGRAGYYSMDLSAPIVAGTFDSALASAACALTAAQLTAVGEQAVFALCRPPGHHAGRDYCAGYCYFNNAALAAHLLRANGKVAILDVDYHAGNGTQDIFYHAGDVLTISLHADPAHQYPYFIGYADECGAGDGEGFHRNFPLPAGTDDDPFLATLDSAIALVSSFQPNHLVVSAGMDIWEGDPLGDFKITTDGIYNIGRRIAALNLPTTIIMEGGYNNEQLGVNVVNFLSSFV